MLFAGNLSRKVIRSLRSGSLRSFGFCPTLDKMESTTELRISQDYEQIRSFTTSDHEGQILENVEGASFEEAEILKRVYKTMREVELIDDFLNKAQRQGFGCYYLNYF